MIVLDIIDNEKQCISHKLEFDIEICKPIDFQTSVFVKTFNMDFKHPRKM